MVDMTRKIMGGATVVVACLAVLVGCDPANSLTNQDHRGYLDNYLTITGYTVTPVVGFVRPGFSVHPDQVEVTEAFEVPLEFLMNPANHVRRVVPGLIEQGSYQDPWLGVTARTMLPAFAEALRLSPNDEAAQAGLEACVGKEGL